jgi:hypothetical protein
MAIAIKIYFLARFAGDRLERGAILNLSLTELCCTMLNIEFSQKRLLNT